MDQTELPNHLANLEPQFTFSFKNKAIFKDVTHVLYSYFERQTTYGTEDCEVMKAFIEMFLPIVFDVPDVLPHVANESSDTMMDEAEEMMEEDDMMEEDVDDEDEDNDTQNSYDSSSDGVRTSRRGYTRRGANGRRSPRHKPSDEDHQRLLKDVLTRTMRPSDKLPAVKKEVIQMELEAEEELDLDKEQKIYNFFGNTTFYCFFRLFQVKEMYRKRCLLLSTYVAL